MSVLVKGKDITSIDCFVKKECKRFENVKARKKAFGTLLKMIQELMECISVVPLLRCISREHHSVEDMHVNEKKIHNFSRIPLRITKDNGAKGILTIHGSTYNDKSCQVKDAFMELFQFSPCPMVLISADTHKVVEANEHFVKLTGQDHTTILGWNISTLRKMISAQDYYQIRSSLFQRKNVKDYKCRVTVAAKEEIIVLNIKHLMLKEQNLFLMSAVNNTEIVELKQHIERLSCLNLVGQLAASIGHEIRNPMTTVRGYLRYMQRKPSFSGFNEQFSMMIRELDRANEIITDFLALAKNRVNGSALENLNKIVEDIAPLMEAMASEIGHSIEFQLQPIPDLIVDKVDIHKVLINLVKNGFEAMDEKGKVTVSTFREQHYIVLQVADEGKGMSPEILGKIGTPFFTTKEKGTGLGLSVCYQIADRHNALIGIKTSNTGSTFSLKLPYR